MSTAKMHGVAWKILISALTDDELNVNEKEFVIIHLDSCSLCRGEFEKLIGLKRYLKNAMNSYLVIPRPF
jgi:anti-sigma factor RsiW